MKLKNLILGLALAFVFVACGEDEDDKKGGVDCSTYGTEIQTLVTDITTAATNYGTDPSVANCNAYFDALEAYIDGIEAYINKCVPDQAALYQSSLDTYRAYTEDLTCN